LLYSYTPICGNGVKDTGEQCDDGNTVNNDGCSSTCKIEGCGDGIKQTGEECDNGPLNGKVCNPLYCDSCTYCSSSCKLITLEGGYCGDGQCNGNETCSTCSCDCGKCQEEECDTCKDSKPLDDSDYDYYYYLYQNNKPNVISGDVTSGDSESDSDNIEKSVIGNTFSIIGLVLIIGVLTLLILIVIFRLAGR